VHEFCHQMMGMSRTQANSDMKFLHLLLADLMSFTVQFTFLWKDHAMNELVSKLALHSHLYNHHIQTTALQNFQQEKHR